MNSWLVEMPDPKDNTESGMPHLSAEQGHALEDDEASESYGEQ